MKFNPISLLIIVAFLYPIIKGLLFKFSSRNIKSDIQEVGSNISFIVSLFLGVYFSKKIFIEHEVQPYKNIYQIIPQDLRSYADNNTIIFYVVVLPIMIFLVYKIAGFLVELINRVVFYPLVDMLERYMEDKSSLFKRISGAVFQLPRSIGYVLLVAFILNILSMLNIKGSYNNYLQSSKPYNLLCREVVIPVTNSTVAKQLPNIIDNSFRVVVKDADSQDSKGVIAEQTGNKRVIVYYNGVTLEEGIKSNNQIDSFAKELGSKYSSSKDKAKAIYTWVGTNISYDNDKANRVLSNDYNVKSGAIPTYQTKKGICFDYACLYVAMARANGLKVRIITGEGFNGVSWVSHAWNQVFIPEENKWINVDPTFYRGGNYFNSKRFDMDHRDSKVAGEWQ